MRYIEEYIRIISSLTKEEFIEKYPAPVLVAVGYIKANETKRLHGPGKTIFYLLKNSDYSLSQKELHPLAGHVYEIKKSSRTPHPDRILIGRGIDNDIIIRDKAVSQFHGYFVKQEDRLMIVDTNSTNGTFVNHRRIKGFQACQIKDEDIIILGRYGFQLFFAATFYQGIKILERGPQTTDDLFK
jgi:pSer/pThr/pTyr-binding forkhead associated (FHA) protein